MLFASCQGRTGRGDVEFHPTPDRIPVVTDPRFIIYDEPKNTLSWMLVAVGERYTVDVKEGPASDMIGDVGDIAVRDDLLYHVEGSLSAPAVLKVIW